MDFRLNIRDVSQTNIDWFTNKSNKKINFLKSSNKKIKIKEEASDGTCNNKSLTFDKSSSVKLKK